MNKIVCRLVALTTLLTVTACAPFPPFRINMRKDYAPANPSAAGTAKTSSDVGNWQQFLVSKGHLQAGKFAAGTFDKETVAATMRFQKWKGTVAAPMPVLPATGTVNWATYHKAVREGMPKYKPMVTALAPHPVSSHSGDSLKPRTGLDNFRINLKNADSGTTLPNPSFDTGGVPWKDVYDWETFLVNQGYLIGSAYPNNSFNSIIVVATTAFQVDAHTDGNLSTYSSGIVGSNTLTAAVNDYGMAAVTPVTHP